MKAKELKQLIEKSINIEFKNAIDNNTEIFEIVARIYNGDVYNDDDDIIDEDFKPYTNDYFDDNEKFSGKWMLDDCCEDGWATLDEYDDVDKLKFYYTEFNNGYDVRVQIVVDDNDKIILFGWSSD